MVHPPFCICSVSVCSASIVRQPPCTVCWGEQEHLRICLQHHPADRSTSMGHSSDGKVLGARIIGLAKSLFEFFHNSLWKNLNKLFDQLNGSFDKESTCNAGGLGSICGLERSSGNGKGYPLQYSGLENSMDCIVHGVTKSWTGLSNFHFHFQYSPL